MKKPEFKTGAFGVEYIDDKQVATRDTTVLPKMVNARVNGGRNKPDDDSPKQ